MGKDYYAILGIERTASAADIKAAYRKQALKWHPDRNAEQKQLAEEKFKEVSEAYEVLSDEKKKDLYDRFGEEGVKAGGAPGGGGASSAHSFNSFRFSRPEDIFSQFFGGSNPFSRSSGRNGGAGGFYGFDTFGEAEGFDSGFGGFPPRPQKAPPIERTFGCTLEELYTGTTKRMKITKTITESGGEKQVIEKILELTVKPGWKEGTRITFAQEGDQAPGIIPADIVFILQQKPHPLFTREKSDLVYTANISLTQALCGAELSIVTLDGRTLNVHLRDVIPPGFSKTVPGEGMPDQKNPEKRGNLVIRFNIQFPTKLTESQKSRLADTLGA